MSDVWFTRHQVPRGARPDAIHANRMLLIKNVERLSLTYQIRLLTALAADRRLSLDDFHSSRTLVATELGTTDGAGASRYS